MIKLEGMAPNEVALIKAHLPELMVMARAKHAAKLQNKQTDITLCGRARMWEECCTITNMGSYTQIMLWYNIEKDTHGVVLALY